MRNSNLSLREKDLELIGRTKADEDELRHAKSLRQSRQWWSECDEKFGVEKTGTIESKTKKRRLQTWLVELSVSQDVRFELGSVSMLYPMNRLQLAFASIHQVNYHPVDDFPFSSASQTAVSLADLLLFLPLTPLLLLIPEFGSHSQPHSNWHSDSHSSNSKCWAEMKSAISAVTESDLRRRRKDKKIQEKQQGKHRRKEDWTTNGLKNEDENERETK